MRTAFSFKVPRYSPGTLLRLFLKANVSWCSLKLFTNNSLQSLVQIDEYGQVSWMLPDRNIYKSFLTIPQTDVYALLNES